MPFAPKDNTIDMRLSLVVSSKVIEVQVGLVSFTTARKPSLGGETSNILIFAPKIGEDFQFDQYFSVVVQMGWFNHQLVVINGVK